LCSLVFVSLFFFWLRSTARIPRVLRGGTFRSRFLHGLCHAPELTNFVSQVAGCALVPHPMELMNGHVNFKPQIDGVAVDKWHFDTTPFVLVLFCTPPEECVTSESTKRVYVWPA
jgi:hypothetical protein